MPYVELGENAAESEKSLSGRVEESRYKPLNFNKLSISLSPCEQKQQDLQTDDVTWRQLKFGKTPVAAGLKFGSTTAVHDEYKMSSTN